MRSIPDCQAELQALAQWVCWFLKTEGERSTKPPINARVHISQPLEARLASPTDPATWTSYDQALRTARHYAGIGFMFSQDDPFCGIDLDKCRNKETGELAQWARRILVHLDSYTEISPSGTGIHIIIRGNMLETIRELGRSRIQHKHGAVEIYDQRRYFTWSGNHLAGTPTTIEARQAQLTSLYKAIFKETANQGGHQPIQPATPLSVDDEWILERAQKMRLNGQKFARLWAGNASDYTRQDGTIDHSRADQALLGMLAYWTGRDQARMEALFRRSGLYRADRWEQQARGGETYGQGSVRLACANCRNTYDPTWYEKKQAGDSSRKQPFPQTAGTTSQGGSRA